MSTSAQPQESVNPKSGMTQTEAKEFVRKHFEEFVNQKNLDNGNVNFAPEFADHGRGCSAGHSAGNNRSEEFENATAVASRRIAGARAEQNASQFASLVDAGPRHPRGRADD